MRTIRRAAAPLASAVLVVSVAACDADQLGAAAVVDGERITVSELQDEVLAFHELAGTEPVGDQSELQRSYLQADIQHMIIEQVGEDAGISVSEADIDQYVADQFIAQNPEGDLTQLMVENMFTEQGFRDAIHDQIMFEAILGEVGDQDAVIAMYEATAATMEIEINPRYGEWDVVALESVSGSISVPAGQ